MDNRVFYVIFIHDSVIFFLLFNFFFWKLYKIRNDKSQREQLEIIEARNYRSTVL